ncbi:hypothetical protein C8Q73DRAFT_718674 [Cubamyces lactineus]|nr:hypothetical protein C8Q73DRAFT_718674 [Cubamyces lactineus]
MGLLTNSTSTPGNPAISIRPIGHLFVSGCTVEGEVELDFRQLRQDNIQEVHVKLRGSAKTAISRNETTRREDIPLVRENASLWTQGTVYPPPGRDTLQIPFRLQLPPDLPPSFHYRDLGKRASVQYSLTAVGVRPGTFQFNRRLRLPLAIVQKDTVGVSARDSMLAMAAGGAQCPWKVFRGEEKIRRGLWGNYATVQVEIMIPDIPVLPLFVPIPFVINIKSTTPPLTRAAAETHPPDKPIFPPVPTAYHLLDFTLQRTLRIRARTFKAASTSDVIVFRSATMAVEEDIPEREWVPLDGREKEKSPDTKGTWVQRASFRSTFRLDCPHTFATDNIICGYSLELKVPFPGIGNDVRISMPVRVTSGLDAPILRDGPDDPRNPPRPREGMLDLPPAYWDANDRDWDDGEKD